MVKDEQAGISVTLKKVDKFSDLDDDKKDPDKEDPKGTVDEKYVGYWECSGANLDGSGYKTDSIDYRGTSIPIARLFQFEFKKDGTGVVKSAVTSKDESFKWSVEGDALYIYEDDESIKFTISGDDLICKDNGMDFKIKKVDKLTK